MGGGGWRDIMTVCVKGNMTREVGRYGPQITFDLGGGGGVGGYFIWERGKSHLLYKTL